MVLAHLQSQFLVGEALPHGLHASLLIHEGHEIGVVDTWRSHALLVLLLGICKLLLDLPSLVEEVLLSSVGHGCLSFLLTVRAQLVLLFDVFFLLMHEHLDVEHHVECLVADLQEHQVVHVARLPVRHLRQLLVHFRLLLAPEEWVH